MGWAVIRIRYRDPQELSPGLHAAAERQGRTTTVYLLPGLTAEQRRAALRRLRISARRGYAPRLPAPQLALALLADRVRTTAGQAGAVFRSHPAGSTVPVMVVSAGAIAFLALSAVSIRVIHPPRSPGQASLAGAAAAGIPAGEGPEGSLGPPTGGLADPGQPGPAGVLPVAPGPGSSAGAQAPGGPAAGNSTGASGGAGSGRGPVSGQGQGQGGGTTLAGGANPTPAPGATASSTAPASSSSSAAAPAPAAASSSAAPSPTPSAGKSGLCLNVGALGVCL
jgi:hypothetical protein